MGYVILAEVDSFCAIHAERARDPAGSHHDAQLKLQDAPQAAVSVQKIGLSGMCILRALGRVREWGPNLLGDAFIVYVPAQRAPDISANRACEA